VFTVMTWNVENFFTPQPADQAGYDAKLAELVDVIVASAPDLLAVQEIGDEQSFQALATALGWTRVLSTRFETPHTIRVGWLSPGHRPRSNRSWICRRPCRRWRWKTTAPP
jgi:hypothetical protein